MPQNKNPTGGRGFCKKDKAHCVESHSTSTAPAAQYLICMDCGNIIHRPHDKAICRWTGEKVNPQAHGHACRGFVPIGGGDAA